MEFLAAHADLVPGPSESLEAIEAPIAVAKAAFFRETGLRIGHGCSGPGGLQLPDLEALPVADEDQVVAREAAEPVRREEGNRRSILLSYGDAVC